MSDDTGIPTESSESVTYATVDDVNDILRSFNFTADTNPTQTQVQNLLSKKTRYVEKQIPTSFRDLEITDLSISGTASSKQKRDKNTFRANNGSVRSRGGLRHNATTDTDIKFQLPHYFVQSLDKLVLKTSSGSRTVDLDNPEDDKIYELNKRDGSIRVDYRYFPNTGDGTASSNRLNDVRIEVSYVYGKNYLEEDITEATAKLVVYDLINSDAFSEIRSDEDAFISLDTFTSRIKDDADEIINEYKY